MAIWVGFFPADNEGMWEVPNCRIGADVGDPPYRYQAPKQHGGGPQDPVLSSFIVLPPVGSHNYCCP